MSDGGYQVRKASPVDASAIAHVYVATWRSSYRTLLPQNVLREMSDIPETLFWWNGLCRPAAATVTLVVEDGEGRVVGFLSGGPDRSKGPPRRAEIYTLYLLRPYQRRGFGTRLVAAFSSRMIDLGFTSLGVWVLAGNSARAFYEALGADPSAVKSIRLGGRFIQEVSYVWPDIQDAARVATGSALRPPEAPRG